MSVIRLFSTMLVVLLAPLALHAQDDYVVTAEDRAFFREIQNAIVGGDREWVAAHIAFPISTSVSGRPKTIKTAKQFLADYDKIVGPTLIAAVRQQSAASLFKNWQGVMIGDGEIWFAQVTDQEDAESATWRYTVIAIGVDTG